MSNFLEDPDELFANLAEPLADILDDKSVTEIYIDRWDNISYMRNGMVKTLYVEDDVNNEEACFESSKHFFELCNHVTKDAEQINENGKPVSYISVNTKPGHRVTVFIPVDTHDYDSYFMTIRLFRANLMTSKKLLELGMFDKEKYEFMKKSLVKGKNILICGRPNSGKTTLMRCLVNDVLNELAFRVAFLEDPRELNIKYDRGFAIEVDHNHQKAASQALRFCLRSSPQLMIIGELLDSEISLTFVRAIEAGFTGTISTIHSNSANVATERLATLASDGSNFTRSEMLSICNEAIDLVIPVDFNYRTGDRIVGDILDLQEQRLRRAV